MTDQEYSKEFQTIIDTYRLRVSRLQKQYVREAGYPAKGETVSVQGKQVKIISVYVMMERGNEPSIHYIGMLQNGKTTTFSWRQLDSDMPLPPQNPPAGFEDARWVLLGTLPEETTPRELFKTLMGMDLNDKEFETELAAGTVMVNGIHVSDPDRAHALEHYLDGLAELRHNIRFTAGFAGKKMIVDVMELTRENIGRRKRP